MGNVRIIHTADNHIGLKFNNYSGSQAQGALVQERLDALKNVVDAGNSKNAHFLVVAGDLFDSLKISAKEVKSVVEILKKSHAEVLVLPGNHDYYDGSDNKLWKMFLESTENTSIRLLHQSEVYRTECEGEVICFYPAPCMSKHHEGHVIGWVNDIQKDPNEIHIGIAHGNVDGLGVDDADRYFNMSESDLRATGVDFWLLGHIHVPFPAPTSIGNPLFFMPATHTPESIKRKIPGYAWLIDVIDKKQLQFEQLTTGNLRFSRQIIAFGRNYSLSDFQREELSWRNPKLILDLKLSGSLSESDLTELSELLRTLQTEYLHVDFENSVGVAVDSAFIQKTYAEGTTAYQWLSAISTETDSELALQLAYSMLNPKGKKS
jgi:DNA repair exonuclease SbcCD nuclease subunit